MTWHKLTKTLNFEGYRGTKHQGEKLEGAFD